MKYDNTIKNILANSSLLRAQIISWIVLDEVSLSYVVPKIATSQKGNNSPTGRILTQADNPVTRSFPTGNKFSDNPAENLTADTETPSQTQPADIEMSSESRTVDIEMPAESQPAKNERPTESLSADTEMAAESQPANIEMPSEILSADTEMPLESLPDGTEMPAELASQH